MDSNEFDTLHQENINNLEFNPHHGESDQILEHEIEYNSGNISFNRCIQ